jgi:hypothetical protein
MLARRRPALLDCYVVKGESAIWNVLMSATGASFVVVAIALVAYSKRTTDAAGGEPTAVIEASAGPEAASAGPIDAGPALADADAPPADASAAADTLADAGPDGAVDEDAADAATDEPDESDGGSAIAAASVRPAQKPHKGTPSKGKPGKPRTRKPR